LVLQEGEPHDPSKLRGHNTTSCAFQRYFHCSLGFRLRLKPHDRHFCQLYNDALSRQLLSLRCIFCVPRRKSTNTLSGNNKF
jgi:hypothetical protein